jgi:hypothetical protein
MISADCRKCEAWIEKDLIYAIGVTKDKKLSLLWLIYGDCYGEHLTFAKTLRSKLTIKVGGAKL